MRMAATAPVLTVPTALSVRCRIPTMASQVIDITRLTATEHSFG
jgi:hypothetical protein